MLFFGAAAVELLGIGALAGLLSNTARYLPRLLLATFSILAGVLVGDLVYTRVRRSAPQMGAGLSYMLARAAQGVIISLAGIIAIDQLGLDSNILVLVVGICAGSVFGAASLAFGLGARTAVSNIIAVHYLSRSYRVGDSVRIGDTEGTIAAITRTAVVLDAPEGRVEVPAGRFSEETSVLVTQEKG
jgi:small-conductance mechanosensitive channel